MANMVKKEDVFTVLEESGDIVDRRTLEVLIARVDKLPMLGRNVIGQAYEAHWMPLPEPPSRDEIERVAKQ